MLKTVNFIPLLLNIIILKKRRQLFEPHIGALTTLNPGEGGSCQSAMFENRQKKLF